MGLFSILLTVKLNVSENRNIYFPGRKKKKKIMRDSIEAGQFENQIYSMELI